MIASISSALFALFLWGSILGATLVFAYEVYAIAAEFGWLA